MVQRLTIIALAIFIVVPLTLPFVLSSCNGVFCAATVGHMDTANACGQHEDAHLSLVQQFGQCTLQQSMNLFGVALVAAFLTTMLWTLIRFFARTFVSFHTTFLTALNAPAALVHMKPFDPLRFAFARGITNARKNTHTVFA